MNRKFIVNVITAGVLISLMLFWACPVLAISNGELDGDRHPNVGAIVAEFDFGWGPVRILGCSGVLIEATVFLTAGHCGIMPPELNPYFEKFLVSFDSEVDLDGGDFIQVEEAIVDPEFGHDMGDLHDIAVFILPEGSTVGITPADLPTGGLLEDMAAQGGLRGHDFVNVGYGLVPEWKQGPPLFLPSDGFRRMSTSPFMALTKSWLKLLMNNDATNQGGVCYGDSGGAHFLAQDPNIVVAITTGGDAVCRALNYNYRLDTLSARSFLSQFVDLP